MKTTFLINTQEWAVERLTDLSAALGRTKHGAPHLELGLRGERAALFELRRQGYTVVARRWTSSKMRGDLDLIAWDADWLCFVEVKTRSERNAMAPAETSVDREKRTILRRMAQSYLRSFPEEKRRQIPVRFDVLSVYGGKRIQEFELFRGAFGLR